MKKKRERGTTATKADKSVQQVMHVGADAWVTTRRRRRQRADEEAWTRRHSDMLQCMHDVYGVDERQNKKRKLYGKHEAMRVCLRMAMSNDEDGRTTVMAAEI
jgi:hypothetical protein